MELKSYFILLVMVFLIVIWQSTAAGQETDMASKGNYYLKAIDQAIAKCEAKSALRHSRSAKIRRVAALAGMKAAYFRNYKEVLAQEMQKEEIGDKYYRVYYFLNKHFYDLIQPKPESMLPVIVHR